MSGRFLKRRSGDTLVEVTIALAILSLLLALGTVGAIGAYRSAVQARERSVAYNLAQRQADALRAYVQSMTWTAFLGLTATNPNPAYSMGGGSAPAIIQNWIDPASGYSSGPSPKGSQHGAFDPATLTSNSGVTGFDYMKNIADLGQNPNQAHMFYMTDQTVGSTPPAWKIADTAVDTYPKSNPLFYIAIVPNRAIAPTLDGAASNDLLRFDVIVRWRSAVGGVLGESSLVLFLSRSEAVSH